ncbi:MAG: hypothetical protein J7494_10300 [Sphingobium sp.]|nr:hypothetical protein [Sphingobium sp.]
MRLLLPLILLAGSPAFAADQQFDLNCDGTKWTQRGGAGEPIKFRAHIDLAAKKWCEGDCKAVQTIASINDREIMLTDESTFNAKVDSIREVVFDREEMMFKHHYTQNKPAQQYMGIQATCKNEAFTPFPGTGPAPVPAAVPAPVAPATPAPATTVATASTGG